MHAVEFLKTPPNPLPGVIAVIGEERALKLNVIEAVAKAALSDGEVPTKFAGKDVELQTVRSELMTVPMWGGKRVIVIEDANDFVTDNRSAVEAYANKPAKKSILLLDLKSLAANTKLFKIINASGVVVECSPLKGVTLNRWVQETAKREYGKTIEANAVSLLLELAGSNLGHLEQELGKLAAYAGTRGTIEAESVRKLVGDWKTETTWAMTDAVRESRVPDALHALDKLMNGGDPALKIHGGVAFVFKKMAVATELTRQGTPMNEALAQAGAWGNEIGSATSYLKRVGRGKAELITRRLLEADVNLKGGSLLNDRTQVELLLLRLSGLCD